MKKKLQIALVVAVSTIVFICCAKTPEHQKSQTITVNDVSFKMIYIGEGTFDRGCTEEQSDCFGNETPIKSIKLDGFHIGQYPVTQKLWVAVMGNNPSYNIGDDLPVERVNYSDALAFISTLSALTEKTFRLPTEAEWEYAARGGSVSVGQPRFSGGTNLDELGWYSVNSSGSTQPVGKKLGNATALYDMSGNVWEWCRDWYSADYYSDSEAINPTGPSSGTQRVLRGGAFNSSMSQCRVSFRGFAAPTSRGTNVGFRLVMKL